MMEQNQIVKTSKNELTETRRITTQNAVSPYLHDHNRLGDVIAAIQVMGTYKFYKLSFDKWADRISGDSDKGEHWQKVFTEHPEFFRLDSPREKASLVWRRQYPKRYEVDTEQILYREEYEKLTESQKLRVSRNPLTPDDIKTLYRYSHKPTLARTCTTKGKSLVDTISG